MSEHIHKLEMHRVGARKKWICLDYPCSYATVNAMNLVGSIYRCSKCNSLYRLASEDLEQEGKIQCPLCVGEPGERFVDTLLLNEKAAPMESKSTQNPEKEYKEELDQLNQLLKDQGLL